MNIEDEIRAHAQSEFPRESCGLVIVVKGKQRYVPCKNVASTPQEHFIIDPLDAMAAEDQGAVIAVVHSHPKIPAVASEDDKVQCEATRLAWHIVHVSVPDGEENPVATDIVTIHPCGYKAPLIGRKFSHGILDCYSLVRDYYREEMGIDLPNFDRRDEWWNNGQNLYMENFANCGFEPIKGPIEVGDIILMQIRSPVPNHAAVYIGNGQILHHQVNRLSSRDLYSGYFQEITRVIIRYKGNSDGRQA